MASATSGDKYTYAESTATDNVQPIFTSKQWSYQIDQNNGSYGSKQVVFDLAGFYNSQRFINPREMYFAIPVCTGLTTTGNGTKDGFGVAPKLTYTSTNPSVNLSSFNDNGAQVSSQFCMGYKSGYWNLIQSIQIQVDGKDVIQLTPNINYHASFVANTTWSEGDVIKHGALTGFKPDSADSWRICSNEAKNTADYGPYGLGVCNNQLPPDNQQQVYPGSCISGLLGTGLGLQGPKYQQYASLSAGVSASTTGQTTNRALFDRMMHTNQYDPTQYVSVLKDLTGYGVPDACLKMTRSREDAQVLGEDRLVTQDMVLQTAVAGADNAAAQINGRAALVAGSNTSSTTAFRELLTTCIIRFKDVCDLFQKLPLTRGLYMRVIVNVNTGSMNLSAFAKLADQVAGAVDPGSGSLSNVPIWTDVSNNTFPGTCPVILAPLQVSALLPSMTAPDNQWPLMKGFDAPATNTLVTLTNASGPSFQSDCGICLYPGLACDSATVNRTGFTLSVAIAKPDPIHGTLTASMRAHNMNACRVYAPIIDLEPQIVNEYISNYKNQAVFYKDVLQFVLPAIQSKDSFTYQLANGIVNAKRLVIVPFYHDDSTAVLFEPTSPFSSAPATVAPQTTLKDFNVLISNMNVFQRNITYSFENFIQEISPCNSISGGLDTGLTSGLVDYHKWTQNYRYYVVDLSRRLAGDNTPKSITVTGTNSSKFPCDFYMFVEYERHLSLDIESGHINVSSN